MESKLKELKARLLEVYDLEAVSSVLQWDQATYMPAGGTRARAQQIRAVRQLAHDKFTDVAVGRLLDELKSLEQDLPYDSDDASLIRITREDYERAIRVPTDFMGDFHSHVAESYQEWTRARPADDFEAMVPYLERMVEFSRDFADFFPGYESVADPLIDYFADEGYKASEVQAIFADLREQLVPMAEAIADSVEPEDEFLYRHFPKEEQLAFGLEVVKRFGYDLERGRQDLTHHPFTTTFSTGDVRITTRVHENDLRSALFATLHEGGHALYEQGVRTKLEGTPLARGASAGAHESQSRLWENLVGRSRVFWEVFFPALQARFSEQLGAVSLDEFYAAINKVEPSLIRVEADEVTYNLHVMLRFDLEQELLEGRLAAADVADAYNARFEQDLGIAPPDNRDGVLQDMHWFGHFLGAGYLGYTLGNIMSAQFFGTALRQRPRISDEMREGVFDALHTWLREEAYGHGRKFKAPELLERATGQPLSIEPYVDYLTEKYTALYNL